MKRGYLNETAILIVCIVALFRCLNAVLRGHFLTTIIDKSEIIVTLL